MYTLTRKLHLVVLYFLYFEMQCVLSRQRIVSHRGSDLYDCGGNWTTPCRTVKHTVNIADAGDEIFIDYSQGKPYMECEDVWESKWSIEISKSISFYGINGIPVIVCNKKTTLFKIKNAGKNITTHVLFSNVVLSTAYIMIDCSKSSFDIVFENSIVKNCGGIRSDGSSYCSLMLSNTSFQNNLHFGIFLECVNLIAYVESSIFKTSPFKMAGIEDTPRHYQNSFASIFNITILDSEFTSNDILIRDKYTGTRNNTNILLKNLLVKNYSGYNYAVAVEVAFPEHADSKIKIQDSIFRNNRGALKVSTSLYNPTLQYWPVMVSIINNTFVGNFFNGISLIGHAAAIVFAGDSVSRVSSCRFLDNKSGHSPLVAVVTIHSSAYVKFVDCYFENRQTSVQSNQMLSTHGRLVSFEGNNTFNLVALKESQPVLSLSLYTVLRGYLKVECPQGYKLAEQRSITGIYFRVPIHFSYKAQCQQCPTKTYTLERGSQLISKKRGQKDNNITNNNIHCKVCPRGGTCDKGLLVAKRNFWGEKTKRNISFVQCPPDYCCKSEDDCLSYHSCQGNRMGTLCGQCPKGMAESLFSTQCIPNAECSLNYTFIVLVVISLIFYLAFFLYQKEIVKQIRKSLLWKRLPFLRNNERSRSGNMSTESSKDGLLKIFFYYYQVINLLKSSVGSSKSSHIMYGIENTITSAFNFIFVEISSIRCPLKDLRAVSKAVVKNSVGYSLLVLIGLLYLVCLLFQFLKRLRSNRERSIEVEYPILIRANIPKLPLSRRIVSAFTHISLLMYSSSAKLCLSLLHCVPVGDDLVLFLDGNIKCYHQFQYFLLGYAVSSILPFCLVPVLGSYLLKLGQIGVIQFCLACIFPLPFCCFWTYLLLTKYRRNTCSFVDDAITNEQNNTNSDWSANEEICSRPCTDNDNDNTSDKDNASVILSVLLGPFRPHKAFMCFPSSQIPWEGFLIFRRLILVIVLTFVYDIQIRLFLASTLCVAILFFHMAVYPFQRKRDNVLESLSLSTHVVLCVITLIKALYNGEDFSSLPSSLPVLNVIENILVIAPLSIVIILVTLSIVVRLGFGIVFCVSGFVRLMRRLARWAISN